MEIKELRIGNYVTIGDGPFKCSLADLQRMSDLYKPVELTEDWLLKLGFVEKDTWFYKEGFCIGYLTTEDNLQIEYAIAGHWGWKVLELKSVHQLQNLYFAITGEELKII